MNRNLCHPLLRVALLLLLFVLFTVLVACWDVRPIGPAQTEVGMAALNEFVFEAIGVHPVWEIVTEWLGILAIVAACGFAAEGACRLIRRKHLRRVERRLWVLAGFYLLLAVCWLMFEKLAINCRPVLSDGVPEPSYPSSHVLLIVCVSCSSAMQLRVACPKRKGLSAFAWAAAVCFSAAAVVGRLLAGVHWFTDVVGAVLLSLVLLMLYRTALQFFADGDKL